VRGHTSGSFLSGLVVSPFPLHFFYKNLSGHVPISFFGRDVLFHLASIISERTFVWSECIEDPILGGALCRSSFRQRSLGPMHNTLPGVKVSPPFWLKFTIPIRAGRLRYLALQFSVFLF